MNDYEKEVSMFGTPKIRAKILLTKNCYKGRPATKEERIEWLKRLIRDRNEMIRSKQYWNEVIKEIESL